MPKGSHEKEKNGSCHILILNTVYQIYLHVLFLLPTQQLDNSRTVQAWLLEFSMSNRIQSIDGEAAL